MGVDSDNGDSIMFLKLLSIRNIAIWLGLMFIGLFVTRVYAAEQGSVRALSDTISTASLIYIIIFFFGTFIVAFGYLAKRDRDGLDVKIVDLQKSKKDYDDFKVHVAETYISRETLRDLVIGPNRKEHEEIKEMLMTQHESFDKRMSQLMDLIVKAMGV